ncbi:heparan-alpha-glucosaminide N-acetyltransferase domain-containing protein [Paucibacter sp. APW11]|uniref:Heparan-alpha-glucosaminide N-acetyltransferase domain-containing protein n=1 Tax=Roseateles aquae TaxID=3077235 RepID=A0ABU3PCB2_9BURK|nr:heparan-alpha-glucosaminide N-acetyltransferase domain-containing protein [Paucibacter sp. APW11]MDT8999930.1 heparan-alpha-glucosaminide N-acetyltransferase domain-containing protein [Paucibacter sp. APW11]
MKNSSNGTAQRLASVDALRGLAVAAMLLVNNPGDWDQVWWPLEHAAWHGCTPTDLIFPFFLFIVGVSLSLALGPRLDRGTPAAPLLPGLLKRALRIVVLGLVLHLLAWWLMHKPEFRLLGVLQRIGLCFAVTSAVTLGLRARSQWLLIAGLAAGYWALLIGAGLPPEPLSKLGNVASRVDAALLGRWAYEFAPATGIGHDPEGLLSTLGALLSALLGLRAGEALRAGASRSLLLGGLLALALAWGWSHWLPFNKQLWTPSFALWTSGWAALALALAHQLIDRWHWPAIGRSFGVNAIAAYAGAWMCTVFLEGFGWMRPLYASAFGWLGPLIGPLGQSHAFALAFVTVWALIVRLLDKRGIYFKV